MSLSKKIEGFEKRAGAQARTIRPDRARFQQVSHEDTEIFRELNRLAFRRSLERLVQNYTVAASK